MGKKNQGKRKYVPQVSVSNQATPEPEIAETKEKASDTVNSNFTKTWLTPIRGQMLFLFFFSVLLYANTLWFDFNLDDGLIITENNFTKKGIAGIPDILSNDAFVGFFGENKQLLPGGRYRPLSHVWFAIQVEIFGLNPLPGHITNVLVYALSCVFLFHILRMLFPAHDKRPWYKSIPFITTALFIAHPLHTEVVANIKGLDEIFSMVGSFAVLYFSLKYVDNRKFWLLPLSFVVFVLALLSKENALTFLAVVPMTLYVFRKPKFTDYISTLAPLLLGVVVYLAIRIQALGFLLNDIKVTELLNDPFMEANGMQRFSTVMMTWGKYLQLLFFPHPLTHDYYPKYFPIIEFGDIRGLLPMLVFAALSFWAVVKIFKKNIVAYGILFFMFTFSIGSNLLINIGTFMNERFVFVSLLGFVLIVAYYVAEKIKAKNIAILILSVILVAYSVKTFTRNFAWKDGLTLFLTDVKTSYNSAKVNTSAGELLIKASQKETDETKKKKMLEEACFYLDRGSKIHPKYLAAWLLYGNALLFLDNYEPARLCYENCLRLNPKHKDALNNMLVVAQRSFNKKQYTIAAEAYRKLIQVQPEKIDHVFDFSVVLDEMGKTDSAMMLLQQVLKRDSLYYKAYNRLGQIYGKKFNRLDLALTYLQKALSINQKDASVWENLGVAYGILGRYKESVDAFMKAIELAPKNAQVYMNLGNTYYNMKDKANGDKYFRKAYELDSTIFKGKTLPK